MGSAEWGAGRVERRSRLLGWGQHRARIDEDVLTTLKIIIIGVSGVGKSSLLLKFTEDTFDPKLAATTGVDFKGLQEPKDIRRAGHILRHSVLMVGMEKKQRSWMDSSLFSGTCELWLKYLILLRLSVSSVNLQRDHMFTEG
ncbi:Ras-related protein Rab-18 [Fukomys damarensis]|uniref:Ras-related protein Rab-18 n=1 Tax=Fukomys damarensis TaxID=885580 RepID=A0A091CP54_FUKDA|nr:Ras-related protein Rab-18 [Fukomys damarensis]